MNLILYKFMFMPKLAEINFVQNLSNLCISILKILRMHLFSRQNFHEFIFTPITSRIDFHSENCIPLISMHSPLCDTSSDDFLLSRWVGNLNETAFRKVLNGRLSRTYIHKSNVWSRLVEGILRMIRKKTVKVAWRKLS